MEQGPIGRGIYDLAEAARLARVKPSTARYWLLGRPPYEPVMGSDLLHDDEGTWVSFLDLVRTSA